MWKTNGHFNIHRCCICSVFLFVKIFELSVAAWMLGDVLKISCKSLTDPDYFLLENILHSKACPLLASQWMAADSNYVVWCVDLLGSGTIMVA